MAYAFAEIAFTPSVRAEQERRGKAIHRAFLSDQRQGGDRLGPEERDFIGQMNGFYQASSSETGWPYVQFRGGAKGFLKVLDDRTLAYADLRGNRQYISRGNLAGNDRVALILMDYARARRLKIWGHAEFSDLVADGEGDGEGQAPTAAPRPEGLVTIRVAAFDWNCPRHIPRRIDAEDIAAGLGELQAEMAELRAERDRLAGLLAMGAPATAAQ